MRNRLASEDTMIWIWMGTNPVGHDWSLGSVSLYSLTEAMARYRYLLARVRREWEVAA